MLRNCAILYYLWVLIHTFMEVLESQNGITFKLITGSPTSHTIQSHTHTHTEVQFRGFTLSNVRVFGLLNWRIESTVIPVRF